MEELKYIPARVRSFLSKLYVGDTSNINLWSYQERERRKLRREDYEHALPKNPCSFFEKILKLGDVSDKERRVIEFSWGLNDEIPEGITEDAMNIFKRLAYSEKVKKRLSSILE